MSYEELIEGLKTREFVGTEGIDSCGRCHKDKKHYVLLTDGLVIYSTLPHWDNVNHFPDELYETWPLDKFFEDDKSFNFEELDEIMKLRT